MKVSRKHAEIEAAAYSGRVTSLTIDEAPQSALDENLIRVTMQISRGEIASHACSLNVSFVMCRENRTLEQIQAAAFEHAVKLLQYSKPLQQS